MRSIVISGNIVLLLSLLFLHVTSNSAFAWTFTAPVTVSNVTSTSVVLSWATDVPAITQVKYGIYVSGTPYVDMLTQQISSPGLSITHSVTITNLNPATTYKAAVLKDDGTFASLPVTIPTNNMTALLTIEISGSGGGAVYSNPSGINCLTQDGTSDCSESYYTGTGVTLMPVGMNSIFNGWSGACINNAGNCSVTISGSTSVTANFIDDPMVKIEGSNTSYYKINPALEAINSSGQIVRARNMMFTEDIIMTTPFDFTLEGGYTDGTFTTRDLTTTIIVGSLEIQMGTVTVDQIEVR